MSKKIVLIMFLFVTIFVISGIGAITFDRIILPYLSNTKLFSHIEFIKKTKDRTTIINKTEQVIIKENDSVAEIASQAATTVVNIISIDPETKFAKTGTGTILTSDGIVVTYRDVISEDPDTKYAVSIFDGKSFNAKLELIDDFTNLAFFKIDAENLPVIPLSDSQDARSGKRLIAIGNTDGEYQNRYTAGLLSNIDKTYNLSGLTVSSSEKLEGVFTTDFSNTENYIGSPAINYNGELVGIIGKMTKNNVTEYFEIPSNNVKNALEKIVNKTINQQPQLGVYYKSITRLYQITSGGDRDRGALVYHPSGNQNLAVISGSAAEKAGIKMNDIIISVDKQEINLANPLSNVINRYNRGKTVEVRIIRSGQERVFNVTL